MLSYTRNKQPIKVGNQISSSELGSKRVVVIHLLLENIGLLKKFISFKLCIENYFSNSESRSMII